MPTSSALSGETFVAVVAKSTLVDPERLRREVEAFRTTGGDASDAAAISEHLVAKSLITKWQAEKLLQGKHKGYFLGKYKLLSLLGKGGMSSVFLAEHTLMRRRCAIKVLPHKRVADSSYLARFHREAQAVASLDHPNIVRAYDVDQQADRDAIIHFLVMEYVEGLSLQELVTRNGQTSLTDSVDYIRQAAVGLAHAHQAGLVHRDIKPGNLLCDNSGVVKILDLGLARFFDNQGQEEALTIQHDEKVLGTADYLAPEQALDSHSVDARADIYSLGCTFYFLLTGHPPFTEGTLTQRLMAHQTKEPPPVEKDRPEIPPTLVAIVRKMMAKKPDDRYSTAAETAEALRKWLSVSAPPEWKKAHKELFAGDAAHRPAPVMAQVVTPVATPQATAPKTVAPAAPVAPPPSSKKLKTPPSGPSKPLSSNIFSFGAQEEPAAAPAGDANLAALFGGFGTDTASPAKSAPKSTPAAAKPAPKSAPVTPVKPPDPVVTTPVEPPVGKSSVVKKVKAPVSTPAAPVSEPQADFSFLNAPATPSAAVEPSGSGAFDFLGLNAAPVAEPAPPPPPPPAPAPVVIETPPVVEEPVVETPPTVSPPVVEPMIEIATAEPEPTATEGLFQFGDFTAPAPVEPAPIPPVAVTVTEPSPPAPIKPAVTVPVAKPVAKVAAPIVEPEFNFGAPAPVVEAPTAVPSFDFSAPPPPAPVVAAPVITAQPVAPMIDKVAAPLETVPVEPAPVPKKKAKPALPPIKLPPALQDRRVQIGIAGGVAVVLLAGVAYGVGLFGGGSSTPVTKKGGGKKTTSQTAPKITATTSGKASANSDWSRKRAATVGATGDFRTLGDALQTVKLHFKPSVRSERFTLSVAAGTYAERIVIDGKGWPNNIVIKGEGGAIVLEPGGADPIIKVVGVEGVQISNVMLKAQGKPVAVELGGNLARVKLQKFTVQGFGDAGIHLRGGVGLSFSDARCQIEEGQFEPGSASAVGVKCTPGDGSDALDTQNVVLQKLRFLGPMAAGVTVSGKDAANLEFRDSIYSETKTGVHLLGKTSWRDFQFVNNTFYKCPNPILVDEQPELSSKGVSFRRNLFAESGPEVVVEKGYNEKQLLETQTLGKNKLNLSTRAKLDGAKNEVPIFGDGGQQGNTELKFTSTASKEPRFLAPTDNAPQRNVGGPEADEKPYVGAVAP